MYNVEQKQHAGKTGEAFYTTLEVCALWPEGERGRAGFMAHLWHVTAQWESSTSLKLQRFLEGSSLEEHLCLLAGGGAADWREGTWPLNTANRLLKPAGLKRRQARKGRDTQLVG